MYTHEERSAAVGVARPTRVAMRGLEAVGVDPEHAKPVTARGTATSPAWLVEPSASDTRLEAFAVSRAPGR